jgi:hypothetical protein
VQRKIWQPWCGATFDIFSNILDAQVNLPLSQTSNVGDKKQFFFLRARGKKSKMKMGKRVFRRKFYATMETSKRKHEKRLARWTIEEAALNKCQGQKELLKLAFRFRSISLKKHYRMEVGLKSLAFFIL